MGLVADLLAENKALKAECAELEIRVYELTAGRIKQSDMLPAWMVNEPLIIADGIIEALLPSDKVTRDVEAKLKLFRMFVPPKHTTPTT